ncbi:MAG: membrane-binding protein [Bacteroidota bacterium]
MKRLYWVGIFLGMLLSGCVENSKEELVVMRSSLETQVKIPETIIDRSRIEYHRNSSIWVLNNRRYSGYIVSYYPDSLMKEKIGVSQGKIQGPAFKWYPDGHLKEVANYDNGKLHGQKKYWSAESDHLLISQLNYHLGKVHGNQKIWYPSGELFKNLNLNMGKEEGIQQAFRKNGVLYANYEARNGRIFGLKKAALCYDIENSEIVYEN